MSANAESVGRDSIRTSPELVLVDESLARRARESLPAPDDTLKRLEHAIWLRRLAALERATAGAELTEDTYEAAHVQLRRPPRFLAGRRRKAVVAAATAASGMSLALLLGVNVNFRGSPAGADSFEAETAPPPASVPSAPSPRATTPSKRPAAPAERPPRATSRTFAWAPLPAASAYHVELFRGQARVYTIDVTEPRFTLPSSWKHAGRVERLDPGTYRWNVWPVVGGLRQSQATVQAELVVP